VPLRCDPASGAALQTRAARVHDSAVNADKPPEPGGLSIGRETRSHDGRGYVPLASVGRTVGIPVSWALGAGRSTRRAALATRRRRSTGRLLSTTARTTPGSVHMYVMAGLLSSYS